MELISMHVHTKLLRPTLAISRSANSQAAMKCATIPDYNLSASLAKFT